MIDKINILIADDEPDSCHFIQRSLTRCGFNVEVAFDGQEALNKIKANKYDFIFLDFYMPKLNGLDVAKFIKDKNIDSIIIVTSGYPADGIFTKEGGVDEFLEKPFSLDSIKGIIDKYTKRGIKDAKK
jgi:DNA-binding response OmpR family regulator